MGGTVGEEDGVHIVIEDVAALVETFPFVAEAGQEGAADCGRWSAVVCTCEGEELASTDRFLVSTESAVEDEDEE